MFRVRIKTVLRIAAMLGALSLPGVSSAEQSSGIGAQAVHLDFAVNVPQIILLRVGSPGTTIDTVTFEPPITPTGVWIDATSGGSQPIMIAGIVPPSTSVRLTADSSVPLSNGSFAIPFSQIRASGSGSFASVSALAFNGATDQVIWSTTGPGMRAGNFMYQFFNDAPHPPGSYSGTVTYTLATP
jgi:hypothetical protein